MSDGSLRDHPRRWRDMGAPVVAPTPCTIQGFWFDTWLFILVAVWMVLLHLLEIAVWAAFYVWKDAIADLQSALYFSAVTYTTTGYGDLVLPERVAARWRGRGADRHPDVRLVDRILLHDRHPPV